MGRRSRLRCRTCRRFSDWRNSSGRRFDSDLLIAQPEQRAVLRPHQPGGGATTIIGRATTAPTGALATTAPAGGREAMAGGAGGEPTIGAAERGCGTILRGSGRAGAAEGVAATTAMAAGAAATATFAGAATDAFTGTRGLRESSSSSFFLASMAFITSPGLEMFERSILGTTGSAPWRPTPPPRACCASLPRKVRTNLLSLVKLERTGVRLSRRNADSWKNVRFARDLIPALSRDR